MRFPYFHSKLCKALWLPLCVSAAMASAQNVTEEVIIRSWAQSSTDQKTSAIRAGLISPAKRGNALAMVGIARMGAEDRTFAQQLFPVSVIRPYLEDADADVAREAARAYLSMSGSDEAAEAEIVAVATSGRSPLRPHEYIRYLRPNGITSEAARQWLTSLAQGPLSEEKFLAVEALIIGSEMPPASLLPQVMELIRSPEYFCAASLVLSLRKFGPPAARHIDELVELRAKLEVEAKLSVEDRTVVLRTPFSTAASVMDEAIAALQE